MRQILWLLAGLALTAVLFSSALAKDAAGARKAGREGREGRGGPPVLFGEITALSKNSMTIKPQLPERMAERMERRREERGKDMPKLPDSITVQLGPDTQWYFDGDTGSRGDFAVGDIVVVKLLREKNATQPTAEIVADPETARQYIMDRMRERRAGGPAPGGPGGWGPGGPEDNGPGGAAGAPPFGPGPGFGPGEQGGPGGFGGRGMGPGGRGMGPGGRGMGPGGHRPAFGTITAISRDSVTIKPEIPDFIKDRLEQHDMPLPDRLPESLTLPIDDLTVFVNAGEKVNKNPFSKGDRVVLLLARGDDDQSFVRAIVDLKTAKAKMEKMLEERGAQRDGPPQGQGKHKAGKKQRQQSSQDSGSKRRNPR